MGIGPKTVAVVCVLLAGAVPAVAQPAEAPSVEAVLAAPFRSDLTASPRGDRAAWVENHEGVRNLWIADGPESATRQLTDFTEDDGQGLGQITFTPDGETLLYVRGGARSRFGDFPNPESDPEGVMQAVWAVSANGGEPRALGEGASPSVSPDGDRVTLLRGGQPYWVSTDGKGEPEPLFRARGSISDLQWSPDGRRVAFVSSRRDHAFIGLYDLERAEIRWIEPSVDRDRSPRWSPDGSRIAFYRFFASDLEVAHTTFGPHGEPYAVWVADPETGEAEEAWRSPEGTGFPAVSGSRELSWASDDRLLFPAEPDGWLRMYSVSTDGGEPVALTPGECIVEDAALSPDRDWLLFNHNCEDLDRRHLSRVRVDGGTPEALSSGEVIDWSPAFTEDGQIVLFLRSDHRLPGAVHRMPAEGGEAVAISPGTPPHFAAEAMVEPEPVVFTAEDGLEIHGQLFLPPGAGDADPLAAVIFLHGGSRRQMLLGWHYSGYYHNSYAFNQYLANAGYVVLSVNFRSGIGYGQAFRQPANYGWQGASEYLDVLAAREYLIERPDVDAARIGLWGGSYGGYLTALGLARDSDLFAAGVDIHGVHDWARTLQYFGSALFDPDPQHPGRADSLYATALAASPNADIDGWRSPVLLVHGDDDRNVDFRETVELTRLLRERGQAEVETLVFPDEVHSFLLHRNWRYTFEAAADFFNRRLRSP